MMSPAEVNSDAVESRGLFFQSPQTEGRDKPPAMGSFFAAAVRIQLPKVPTGEILAALDDISSKIQSSLEHLIKL